MLLHYLTCCMQQTPCTVQCAVCSILYVAHAGMRRGRIFISAQTCSLLIGPDFRQSKFDGDGTTWDLYTLSVLPGELCEKQLPNNNSTLTCKVIGTIRGKLLDTELPALELRVHNVCNVCILKL